MSDNIDLSNININVYISIYNEMHWTDYYSDQISILTHYNPYIQLPDRDQGLYILMRLLNLLFSLFFQSLFESRKGGRGRG